MSGAPQTTGSTNPNIVTQSANAYTGALGAANAAAYTASQYQPINVSAPTVSAPSVSATSIRAPGAYTPQQIAGNVGSIDPMMINPTSINTGQFQIDPVTGARVDPIGYGQIATTDLNPYLNPFTQNVIDTTMTGMNDALLNAINTTGDRAEAAGAYGGTRHGVAEGVTNSQYVKDAAAMQAQLNLQNHLNAQNMAQFDIGTRLTADQFNAGLEQQSNLADQSAAMQAAIASGDYGLRAALANQATALSAAQSNQRTALDADITQMQARLTAMQADQQAALNAGLADRAAQLQAAISNQQTQLAAAQATAANQMNASIANSQNSLSAALANQQAAYNAAALQSGTFLNTAGTLGSLSMQGYNMGNGIIDNLSMVGSQQQALDQMLIDAANAQFNQWATNPQTALTLPLTAVGAANMGQQTSTTSQSPGLFNYLALALGACWVAREVYGVEDDRWQQFRAWLFARAPTWLFDAYIKHGEAFAGVVRKVPLLKRVLRPLMDRARRSIGFEA